MTVLADLAGLADDVSAGVRRIDAITVFADLTGLADDIPAGVGDILAAVTLEAVITNTATLIAAAMHTTVDISAGVRDDASIVDTLLARSAFNTAAERITVAGRVSTPLRYRQITSAELCTDAWGLRRGTLPYDTDSRTLRPINWVTVGV